METNARYSRAIKRFNKEDIRKSTWYFTLFVNTINAGLYTQKIRGLCLDLLMVSSLVLKISLLFI